MTEDVDSRELEVMNDTDKSVRVIIEPWGEERMVGPRRACQVVYDMAPGHTRLELEYFEGGIVIHFPTDSSADFSG